MVRVSSILALTLGAGLSLAGFGGALAQVTRHPPRSVAPQGSARTFGSAAVYYPNCAAIFNSYRGFTFTPYSCAKCGKTSIA